MARKSLHVSPRGMKWCPRCQTDKAPAEFGRLNGGKDVDAYCIDCRRQTTKKWRESNPDRFVASQEKRRVRTNRPGVYVIDIGIEHLHKIGKCSNIAERLRRLSEANPRVHLVMFIPASDPSKLEARLHQEMAHRQIERELYHLTKEDIVQINEICHS
jgi:hypothetical protein